MAAVLISMAAFAQKTIPAAIVDKAPKGIPLVVSFWDTTCRPCLQELGALSDAYDDWRDEIHFEVVAVSTDDVRSSSKALPLAQGRGWPFIIVLDPNGDMKRSMNVQSNPTVFVVDKTGKIVYSHTGYTPGSELEIYDALKKLSK